MQSSSRWSPPARRSPIRAISNTIPLLEARYTPPDDPSTLRTLLTNWDRYVNAHSDVDPLVKMAVSHYQFEAIHPFTDGNGRTGRILNTLQLCQEGLLRLPILYLSRYFIGHKDDYYRLLDSVTQTADWTDWLLFTIEGVRDTAQFTLERVNGIRQLTDQSAEQLRRILGSANRDLLAVLFEQPYSRVRELMARCAASRPAPRTPSACDHDEIVRYPVTYRPRLISHSEVEGNASCPPSILSAIRAERSSTS